VLSADTSATSETLHQRVRAFIEASAAGAPAPTAERFDELALEVARFQAAHVPPVARLWQARRVALHRAADVRALPGLPTDVFRLARVAAHAPELDVRVFRTSGTTQGAEARGEHPMRTTRTYEQAALSWGARLLWPDGPPARAIVLAAHPRQAPDSSLSFMLELFVRSWNAPASWHFAPYARVLDARGVAEAAAEARAAGEPVMVLGTSFAFVHLDEATHGLDLRLPPGSSAMQTGGFKGRSREVSHPEMRALIATSFGLDEARVVAEYGMTELSSQLYEGTLAGRGRAGVYLPPPWMRVDAVDPSTLEPLAPGDVGIARIVDLANVDSALVVQTADRVRWVDGGIELLGRQPGAVPRGCSLAIDQVLGRDAEGER
jgi:hypothetical protein